LRRVEGQCATMGPIQGNPFVGIHEGPLKRSLIVVSRAVQIFSRSDRPRRAIVCFPSHAEVFLFRPHTHRSTWNER
jgi:hypothetical protein